MPVWCLRAVAFYALPQVFRHARLPRGRYNGVEVGEPRLKSDQVVCEGGVGDENRRISEAARCMNYWDRMTGHAFYGADDTADGGCFSRAEIKYERWVGCIEMAKRLHVRGGKIADVDEVAFACSVRSWIVGSEDV